MIVQTRLHDASFSRVMWQNSSTPSSIKQTQLNGNDLHPKVLSESLIKMKSQM